MSSDDNTDNVVSIEKILAIEADIFNRNVKFIENEDHIIRSQHIKRLFDKGPFPVLKEYEELYLNDPEMFVLTDPGNYPRVDTSNPEPLFNDEGIMTQKVSTILDVLKSTYQTSIITLSGIDPANPKNYKKDNLEKALRKIAAKKGYFSVDRWLYHRHLERSEQSYIEIQSILWINDMYGGFASPSEQTKKRYQTQALTLDDTERSMQFETKQKLLHVIEELLPEPAYEGLDFEDPKTFELIEERQEKNKSLGITSNLKDILRTSISILDIDELPINKYRIHDDFDQLENLLIIIGADEDPSELEAVFTPQLENLSHRIGVSKDELYSSIDTITYVCSNLRLYMTKIL